MASEPPIHKSRLIERVRTLLEDHLVPAWIFDNIEPILEWWQSGAATQTTAKGGFLLVGVDPVAREVVINLDRDRVGHITFSPMQARSLAALLVKQAGVIDGG